MFPGNSTEQYAKRCTDLSPKTNVGITVCFALLVGTAPLSKPKIKTKKDLMNTEEYNERLGEIRTEF